jgi:Tfp pilus assembly protein PilF
VRPKTLTRLIPAVLIGLAVVVASTVVAGGPTMIRGKVVDSAGDPLAGVAIQAVADGLEAPVTASTKKKGTFALRVPDWDATYRVTFTLDGYTTAEATVRQDPDNPPPITITMTESSEQSPPPTPTPTPPPTDGAAPSVSEQRVAAIPVYNEGVDALEADDAATALAKFQQAAEIDPAYAQAYRAIAAVALEAGEYAMAADAAETYLTFDPDDGDAVGTAYYAELMIGDTDRMAASARRLAELNPEVVPNELVQHSVALFENNQNVQSRALLEVILELEPDLPEAQLQLGLTCNALGDVGCARTALSRFLELAPDDPNAPTAEALLEYTASQQ